MHKLNYHAAGYSAKSRYRHRRRERRPEVSPDIKRLLAWVRRNRLIPYPEGDDRKPIRMSANGVLVLQFVFVLQSTSGYASLSSAGIAEEEGCCRRTVLRWLDRFENVGLLEKAPQYRGHRRIANQLRINWGHQYWKSCAASDPATREVSDTSEAMGSDNLPQRSISPLVALAITRGFTPVKSKATDGPVAEPPPPASSAETDKPQNLAPKEEARSIPAWTGAILSAAILRLIGVQLQASEAGSILNTCRKRRLTDHDPESVVGAMHDELAHRNGFDRLCSKRFDNPGAVIHSAAHRINVIQITNKVSENKQNSTNLVDRATNPINNPNSAQPLAASYDETKRRLDERAKQSQAEPSLDDNLRAIYGGEGGDPPNRPPPPARPTPVLTAVTTSQRRFAPLMSYQPNRIRLRGDDPDDWRRFLLQEYGREYSPHEIAALPPEEWKDWCAQFDAWVAKNDPAKATRRRIEHELENWPDWSEWWFKEAKRSVAEWHAIATMPAEEFELLRDEFLQRGVLAGHAAMHDRKVRQAMREHYDRVRAEPKSLEDEVSELKETVSRLAAEKPKPED